MEPSAAPYLGFLRTVAQILLLVYTFTVACSIVFIYRKYPILREEITSATGIRGVLQVIGALARYKPSDFGNCPRDGVLVLLWTTAKVAGTLLALSGLGIFATGGLQ